MTRRAFILAASAAAALRADSSAEVLDLLASMASALAEDNAAGFAAALSDAMPGRNRLVADVRAAIQQAELSSAATPISNEGDGQKRTVVLDWTLSLKQRNGGIRAEQRRQALTFTVVREGKKWRVTSLDGLTFFAPPNFR